MFDVLSFASYLQGPPKNWAAHSGGIHPAMPQAMMIPGTHGTSLESADGKTQKLAWKVSMFSPLSSVSHSSFLPIHMDLWLGWPRPCAVEPLHSSLQLT